jgi:peptide/nickel transport system ATP-binding protein
MAEERCLYMQTIREDAGQPNNVLLEIKDLKTYFLVERGVVRAVDGVTFDILRGGTLGVLGESGCGKSVTALSILRLIRPPGKIVAGQILFHTADGDQVSSVATDIVNLVDLDPRGRRIRDLRGSEIAMVFQDPMTSLDPLYAVGHQIVEGIVLHQGISRREAWRSAVDMLDRVGMPQPGQTARRYPHQLSGGMRQRAMIAMALSCHPRLLIADEPTTALDVTTEAQILELMNELRKEIGMAIMYITHDLGVIAEMAEEVVVMYLGKVVERANVRSIFYNPQHPYTRALLKSIPRIGKKSRQRLESITGMVPDPSAIPQGCSFHPRCPELIAGVCDCEEPALHQAGQAHWSKCHLHS